MTFRVASAFAVLFVVGSVAIACSSSSSSGGTTGGGKCTSNGTGTGSAECGSCIQSNCSSEYNQCFGSGGACASWYNGGCNGEPPDACISCAIGPLLTCQNSKCSAQCKSSSGTDSGVPGDTGSGGGCAELAACCPTISADAGGAEGCTSIATAGNESNCSSLLAGYKAAGYCK
jgi:hypothetical protein